jgi:arylesterase/paraoxonase
MSPGANWAVKSALTWLAVIALLAAGFALRYALVQGVFTSMAPTLPGECRSLASGLEDPADLAVDSVHNVMFVSAADHRVPGPRDGIYLMKLSDLNAAPVRLDGPPANFHPGGISLYRAPDGSDTLMVIDHKPGGRSLIETYGVSFDGETAKLSQQSAMQGNSLVSPNGITATGPSGFYATNDHVSTSGVGRFAEDYLLRPRADVVLSKGMGVRIAAQRIAFPSGILARNGFLYVAAANERRVIALSIEDFTGNLTELGSLALPARLGNISADTAGNLIIAGQSKPGSSQVFRVRVGPDGVPLSYETLFSDDGHTLKGASAAAIWNGRLFIGASDDNKILTCTIK